MEGFHLIPPAPPIRYWTKPLGIDYDFQVLDFVARIRSLSSDRRLIAIDSITSEERRVLYQFGTRSAPLSVRLGSPDILTTGLFAIVLANYTDDYRETYIELAVLRDAANRIAIDFDALLLEASKQGTAEMNRLTAQFIDNRAAIGEFGIRVIEDDNGFRYEVIPPTSTTP